ncbi:response regulator [Paenibacillus sp. R14(2021)]|uniref:response regulator n=1 Tax=Paenibacillus sp. R14(2021) TaxID=2859228 RepID=UPI001C6159B0|nr:response regulator [Paenibacillus sp. R14(2021)]
MFKVLIVDDESLFREYLRTIVNWETYGFTICGEARNGIEALEVAKVTYPDLALVDINMPLMDGLKLSEAFKELYPDLAIVLVTGHGEFEYARQALKLGVEDYILKPFDLDELFLTLMKTKNRIQQAAEDRKTRSKQAEWLKAHLFHRLVDQDTTINQHEIAAELDSWGFETDSDAYIVMVTEIDDSYQLRLDRKEMLLWKNTIINILHEMLDAKGRRLSFLGPEDRIVTLCQLATDLDPFLDDPSCLEKLCVMVKRHFKFTVTLGVGNPQRGLGGIRESYLQALAALGTKPSEGSGRVIRYRASDMPGYGRARSKQIFEEAKRFIEQNYRNSELNVEEITKIAFVNGSYLRKIFNREVRMSVSDYITHVRMQRAREFIQLKKSNIAAISEMVGYNDPGYFSKCFKKYYGVTPKDYENQINR